MTHSPVRARNTAPLRIAHPSTRFLWLALAILLAGFAVRILLYDYHGLEGDDAYSLSLSRLPLETLVPGLMRFELDIHPPLHFLMVKGWAGLAGESLLSLRLLNYVMDLGVGALLMRLTGRALNRRAALAAGVLWSIAPLLLASDLLVRMYTLLALLAAAGIAAVIEAEWAAGKRRYALYGIAGLCALAAMYTHMIGFVLAAVLATGILTGLLNRRIDKGSALVAFAALAAAGILSLPYAQSLWALYQSGRPLGAEINTLAAFPAAAVPDVILSTLLTGRAWVVAPFLLTGITLLVLAAVWWRYRRRGISLVIMTAAGIAAMIALAWVADLYKPRYLAPFVAPLLAVIAGATLLTRPRLGRAALLLVPLALSGAGLLADFDRTLRDDWVAAAAFIERHEQPGDTIIVIPDWGGEAFRFHYRGAANVHSLLPGVSQEVDLDGLLSPLVEGQGRVWYVWYQPLVSDPQALADGWFRARAVTMTEVFPSGIQVKLYDFAPIQTALPQTARPLDATFGDTLALRGVEMPVTSGSARDTRLHPPSAWVQVILYWESLHPGAQMTPRVRLTDSIGQVYGGSIQRDNDLLVKFPVRAWQPGEIVRAAYDLNLNPDMPAGTYSIEVMVLDASGQPLPAVGANAGAQWVIAGQFVVE